MTNAFLLAFLLWQPVEEDTRPVVEATNVTGEVDEWITVRAMTSAKEVQFVAIDRGLKVFPSDQLIDRKSTIVEARYPGEYRLLAYTGGQDLPSLPKIIIVTVRGAQPPPGPTPPQPVPPGPTPPAPVPPAPTPDPAPSNLTAKKLLFVVVQTATANTDQITAMLDPQIWERQVVAKGHRWVKLNTADPAAKTERYATQEKLAGGVPFVVIMDDAGDASQPVFTWLNKDKIDIRLPANEETLARVVAKYTRK